MHQQGRYTIENAAHRVDGYFVPRAGEDPADAFARAKAECVLRLEESIADVKALSIDQFKALSK